MPSNRSRGDSGLPSTTAASQTVADPAARWHCPECYTPTYKRPASARTPAASHAAQRSAPNDAASACPSPRRRCRRGCGPRESTCRRPRRTAAPARRIPTGSRGEGASADDLGSASDCRRSVTSLPAPNICPASRAAQAQPAGHRLVSRSDVAGPGTTHQARLPALLAAAHHPRPAPPHTRRRTPSRVRSPTRRRLRVTHTQGREVPPG